MARKNYKIDEVLRSLSKKNDIRILGSTICMLTDKVVDDKVESINNPIKLHDLGNGSWGKIGFLQNYCGYKIAKVENWNEFKKMKR